MKILKIEFNNINSLRGQHVIDFTSSPFTVSSLFAITGPTGSGKSSILDVISLALFNQVPRIPGGRTISKNDILKFGAILTRNQKEAMARVTYQCNSGMYSSEWNIATNRNHKLRDHEMEITDLSSGKLLALKKSDVPAKNEELIGLSYDQFIKAVLLAQGEFAQFLKVNKKERGALLEKITGTGIYRKLGIKAYEKYTELNKAIEKQQQEIEIIGSKLLSEERRKQLISETQKQDLEINVFTKTLDSLTKNIELKNVISNQHKEIELLSNKKATADANLTGFNEEFGEPLKQHEKVQLFADDLRNWSSNFQHALELELESSNINKDLEKNIALRNGLELELEKLISEPVSQANFEDLLEKFKTKILGFQEEKKEKERDWVLLKQSFDAAIKPLDFSPSKDSEENRLKLIALKISSENSIQNMQESMPGLDFTSIESERNQVKSKMEQTRLAEKQYDKILLLKLDLQKNESERKLIEPELAKLPNQIRELEQLLQIENVSFKNLNLQKENQLLQASLSELRSQLPENGPCPLCGSLEHPFAQHLPEKRNDLDAKIIEQKNKIETNSNKLATLKANHNNYKSRLDSLIKQENDLFVELKDLEDDFKHQFKDFKLTDALQWDEKLKRLEEKLDLLSAFEKEKISLAAINEALPIVEKIKVVIAEGQALATKISELYSGKDIHNESKELQNRFSRLQQEQLYLKERKTKLVDKVEINKASTATLEHSLSPLLSHGGFKSLKDAREALLPESKFLDIRNKLETIKAEIDRSLTSIKLLKNQLSENLKKDTEKPLEELEQNLKFKQEKLHEVNAIYQEHKRQLKNHQENLEEQQQLKASIEEREKQTLRWRLLNTIIGDRTGNKFNEFAQDLTLSQLLQLANLRLRDLSDRYLIDKPIEEEDDGLVAIDEHMGGQRRSVKTLSGGETFILSLAMALALSDLASKNVEINSLFIDEGFGTLDPETLDQTLDTLEKLQAESSKTIGIISHVDSLKERIATQIKLTRNGQGYSSLEVVG